MDLESITLSEISQRKTNIVWYPLYVEPKKYNKLGNITKKKQTHTYREQTSGYQWGEGRGKRQYRGKELRGTNYYILKKGARTYCTKQGILPIFYNNINGIEPLQIVNYYIVHL